MHFGERLDDRVSNEITVEMALLPREAGETADPRSLTTLANWVSLG